MRDMTFEWDDKNHALNKRKHGQGVTMRTEYDFSNAQKNPYASRLEKQATIRLDEGTIKFGPFSAIHPRSSAPMIEKTYIGFLRANLMKNAVECGLGFFQGGSSLGIQIEHSVNGERYVFQCAVLL